MSCLGDVGRDYGIDSQDVGDVNKVGVVNSLELSFLAGELLVLFLFRLSFGGVPLAASAHERCVVNNFYIQTGSETFKGC